MCTMAWPYGFMVKTVPIFIRLEAGWTSVKPMELDLAVGSFDRDNHPYASGGRCTAVPGRPSATKGCRKLGTSRVCAR
jgi:hypothetical protein